jgi:hypothetical protein
MTTVNISQWLHEQHELNNTLYVIVDPQSPHQPHIAFCQYEGIDGAPLMSPEALTNPQVGPWLLPVNARFLDWWQQNEHAESGILIAADSSVQALRTHFASVFQAIMQGETVFFPFYKPSYIAAMLPRLHSEEITALLNNYQVLIRYSDQWQCWQSERAFNQTQAHTQNEPWWVIKAHHLDSAPNLPLLSLNVESWLWQNQPQLLQSTIEQGLPSFHTLFQSHFTALESVAKTQSQPLTVQQQTLIASVIALYGQAVLTQNSIQQSITEVKDDELLFGLKAVFGQLQGEA